jgi:thiamine biosynthesis lipoprotein
MSGGGAEGVHVGQPGDLRDVRRFSHEAMATVYEVYAVHADRQYAAQAAQAGFDLVDRLERELSRFLPNSDVARINHLAAGESARVAPSTLECLVIARHMFELTGGAFDISIGTGLASLDIDPDELVVRASTSGVQVDLGGIGKGYAVDRAVAVLHARGVSSALVSLGGSSVYGLGGPPGGEAWPMAIADPTNPEREALSVPLRDRALSVSGGYARSFVKDGVTYSHIMDPRTGRPVSGVLSVAVLSASATDGDALDNVLFVQGLERARAFVSRRASSAATEVLFFEPAPQGYRLERFGAPPSAAPLVTSRP